MTFSNKAAFANTILFVESETCPPANDPPAQPDLFDVDGQPHAPSDGYSAWRRQRDGSLNDLGRQTGLPLNHPVEVVLRDGVRLRGRLRLQEESLFVEPTEAGPLALRVDGVEFLSNEIESCVRFD